MSLSVAVFIHDHSVSGVAYSGGRYHGLLIAYAMAHSGAHVSVVVNNHPASSADLEGITEETVDYILTADFDPAAGAFYPKFYGCAEQVATRCGATPVLINYESANWFNSLWPKDRVGRSVLSSSNLAVEEELITHTATRGSWVRTEIMFRLPRQAVGKVLELRSYGHGDTAVHTCQNVYS